MPRSSRAMPPCSPLVLVGPMGAGKTSIGRRVSKALGIDFIDTDAAVRREHGPIEQIFQTHGEAAFRAWERAAVREALGRGDVVVSLGGGAVLDAVFSVEPICHEGVDGWCERRNKKGEPLSGSPF